jgi:UTP-glucose-1-phosphate uridylyltransferase
MLISVKLKPHLGVGAWSRDVFTISNRYILEIGHRISFVTQDTQEGFGLAVCSAKERVGDEPFLLMFGDHLYNKAQKIVYFSFWNLQ